MSFGDGSSTFTFHCYCLQLWDSHLRSSLQLWHVPFIQRCVLTPTNSSCWFARFRPPWRTQSWQLLFPLSKLLPINSQKSKLFPFHFPRGETDAYSRVDEARFALKVTRDRNSSLLMHRSSYSVIAGQVYAKIEHALAPQLQGLGGMRAVCSMDY